MLWLTVMQREKYSCLENQARSALGAVMVQRHPKSRRYWGAFETATRRMRGDLPAPLGPDDGTISPSPTPPQPRGTYRVDGARSEPLGITGSPLKSLLTPDIRDRGKTLVLPSSGSRGGYHLCTPFIARPACGRAP